MLHHDVFVALFVCVAALNTPALLLGGRGGRSRSLLHRCSLAGLVGLCALAHQPFNPDELMNTENLMGKSQELDNYSSGIARVSESPSQVAGNAPAQLSLTLPVPPGQGHALLTALVVLL